MRFCASKRSSIKKSETIILQEFRGPIRLKDPDYTLYIFIRLTGANFLLAEKTPICYKHAFYVHYRPLSCKT